MKNRNLASMGITAAASFAMLAITWPAARAQVIGGGAVQGVVMIAPMPGMGGGAATTQPLTAEQEKTPWAKPVEGLAIRVVADPTYRKGQAIRIVAQIKNTSDKPCLLPNARFLNPLFGGLSKLAVTKPDGQPTEMGAKGAGNMMLRPQMYKELAPGEILQFDLDDLVAALAPGTFDAVGKYSVAYTYTGKKPDTAGAPAAGPGRGAPGVGPKFDEEQLKKIWVGEASGTAAFALQPLGKDDLSVHEWGVFSVMPTAEYANADMMAEWGSMPDFFYRQFPTPHLRMGNPMKVTKPIVYFYTPLQGLKVHLEVTFANKGAPVVWWPAAIQPTAPMKFNRGGMGLMPAAGGGGAASAQEIDLFHNLVWEGWLGDKVPAGAGAGNNMGMGMGIATVVGPAGGGGGAAATDIDLPKDSWLRDARLKDAALFTTMGQVMVNNLYPRDRAESERFIYYDGLVPSPNHVTVTKADAKSITLANAQGFAIKNLYVVDRQGVAKDGTVRFAQLAKPLDAGATAELAFRELPAAQWANNPLLPDVKKALTDAGLFAPEADALLKIWHKGFFQGDGLTIFYVLPQSEYDRLLPAKLDPAPAGGMVRVGLVMLAHAEGAAAIAERIKDLLKKLDSDSFEEREAATAALIGLGSAAIPAVQDAMKNSPSPEVKQRCKTILQNTDATQWLNKAHKATGDGEQNDPTVHPHPPIARPPIRAVPLPMPQPMPMQPAPGP